VIAVSETVFTSKNSKGTLCNVIGGSIPTGAKAQAVTVDAPAPVPNDDNDPDGAKLIVEVPESVPNKGFVELPEGGANIELGGTGAPGIDVDQIERDAQSNAHLAIDAEPEQDDDDVDAPADADLPPAIRVNRRRRGASADAPADADD
jgi:hypothetical protein